MKVKLLFFNCLLILFFVNGCQNTSTTTPGKSQYPQTINTPISMGTYTESATMISPSVTSIKPTMRVSSEPKHTKQELITIDKEVYSEVPHRKSLTGVIVAGIPVQTIEVSDIYLMDAQSGTKISELPPDPPYSSISSFSVSPNGKLAAYYSSSNAPKNFYIINNKGEVLLDMTVVDEEGKYLLGNLIPGERVSWDGVYWLDDESLVTSKYPLGERDELEVISPIYFRPFQKTAKEYLPVYPDISLNYINYRTGLPSFMVFDPALSRLLYVNKDSRIVLYDLENDSIISQYLTVEEYYQGDPVWSKDGSKFLTIGIDNSANQSASEDIYEITRDGVARRLTYFETLITDYTLVKLSWSPDEKKIAFLVNSNQTPCGPRRESPYLGVYEYDSPEKVKLYCYESFYFFTPVWSPDSRQLLLMTRDPDDWHQSPMLLVDTEEDYAAVMDKNLLPVAWMAGDE